MFGGDHDVNPDWYAEVAKHNQHLYQLIQISESIYDKSMKVYLLMLSIRIIEMHRILKPTGSIYLHCDPTASHYLKLVMDAVFGKKRFRNEITWKRHDGNNNAKKYSNIADILLYYCKERTPTWNPQYTPLSKETLKEYNRSDPDGRRWTTSSLLSPTNKNKFTWRGTTPTTRGWAFTYEQLEQMYAAGEIITLSLIHIPSPRD